MTERPEPLWTGEALLAATGARLAGALPASVNGVSIDTRTLMRGDLYCAIKGDVHDGHDFVGRAFERGAAAALVDEAHAASLAGTGPLLVVADVLSALGRLGRAARARTHARIVAITGSVGKTGTKEALRHVLAAQGAFPGATHASVLSYNNHWGVPLTLARMPASADFGVFEIGMNHPWEILPLAAMVRPHVAVITTVEPVHLEAFRGGLPGIADAKSEIFSGLEPGGVAVINRDNPLFGRMEAHARASRAGRVIGFGEHAEADVRLIRVCLKPDMSAVEADVLGQRIAYRVGSPGRHVVMNTLAILAVVRALGGDIALAGLALAELKPPPGRGERVERLIGDGRFSLTDETFNANPASMRAALSVLSTTPVGPRGRRVAVLGDMLELGPEGEALHAGLLQPILDARVDVVFACGPLMRSLWDRLPDEIRGCWSPDSELLAPKVAAKIRAGDAVMVKGSKGSRMNRIVQPLEARFAPAVMLEAAM